MMLFLLDDYSDHLPAPGFAPLPAKAATRQRTRLLPGSCGLVQPLPNSPGEPLLIHSPYLIGKLDTQLLL